MKKQIGILQVRNNIGSKRFWIDYDFLWPPISKLPKLTNPKNRYLLKEESLETIRKIVLDFIMEICKQNKTNNRYPKRRSFTWSLGDNSGFILGLNMEDAEKLGNLLNEKMELEEVDWMEHHIRGTKCLNTNQ